MSLEDAEYVLCPKCSTAYTGKHHCRMDPPEKKAGDLERLLGVMKQARRLAGHFSLLGLQLATSGFLSVAYGTAAVISLGIVPIDKSKDEDLVVDTKLKELNFVGNLILRMARSAQVFSTDLSLAGFSLRKITVIVTIGLDIPSVIAILALQPSEKKPSRRDSHATLLSKVVHSPLHLLENLSTQVLAMAQNFRAVGFELSSLGGGPWLSLTVGTYFGITLSVCPIKSITPLTQAGKNDALVALPLEHLTAFQSVILNLLLRANQTISLMLAGKAEVGMITLALTRVGLAIPSLTATVSCVSVTRAKTETAAPPVVKEEVLVATKAELDALQSQIKAQAPPAAPPVTENYETFLHEVETQAGVKPAAKPGAKPTAEAAAVEAKHDNFLVKTGKEIIHGVSQGVSSIVHGTGETVSESAAALNAAVDTVAKGVEKGVNTVIVKPVKGVVQGLGNAWDEMYEHVRSEDDLGVLEATEEVAARVKRHGFRLCNPRWLDLTIGTVLGCAIYIEPVPTPEKLPEDEKELPNDLAEVIWVLFKRAITLVEDASDTFQKKAIALNSVSLRAANLGLGIPIATFGITLDRNI